MSRLSSSPVWTWMKIEQQKRSVFQQYNCVKIVHKFAEAIAHRIRLNGSTVCELVKSAILCASDHDGERCIRSCRNVVRWSRSWFVARRYRYHWTLIGNPSPEIQCRAIPFQPLGCSPQGPTVEPRAVLFLKPVEAGSSNLAWSTEQGDATVNFRGQEVKGQVCRNSLYFHTQPTFDDAPVRGFPSEYCYKVWHGKKLEWWVYQVMKKVENRFTRVDTIHERDRQTDTARQHRRRAAKIRQEHSCIHLWWISLQENFRYRIRNIGGDGTGVPSYSYRVGGIPYCFKLFQHRQMAPSAI